MFRKYTQTFYLILPIVRAELLKTWSSPYLIRAMPFDPCPGVCAALRFVRIRTFAGFVFLLALPSCIADVPSGAGGILPSGYPAPNLDLPWVDENSGSLAETERDWAIARGTVAWARDLGLDTLPIGEVVATLGTTFVGTPYKPGTLEIPGHERLVVNLRTFDCVTLVEHVLVLARLTVSVELLENESSFRDWYRDELTRVRYRDGVLSGYPSRLHYFSEWIRDADAKGIARSLSEELGGIEDLRPIGFMSANPESYRQLGEVSGVLEVIREMEARVTEASRFYIPQDQIAEGESRIQNGDVIAAVSTLEGLDIAHTGIALWQGDRLHILHAPLVGDSVEISIQPLAERIQGFSSQMGIMVARPLQP